jgi:hypothetical protein
MTGRWRSGFSPTLFFFSAPAHAAEPIHQLPAKDGNLVGEIQDRTLRATDYSPRTALAIRQ